MYRRSFLPYRSQRALNMNDVYVDHVESTSKSRGRCRGSRKARLDKHRHSSRSKNRPRMEEEARKLLEEGISKKVLHPGRGELPSFPNGTKVTTTATASGQVDAVWHFFPVVRRSVLANAITKLTCVCARVFNRVSVTLRFQWEHYPRKRTLTTELAAFVSLWRETICLFLAV